MLAAPPHASLDWSDPRVGRFTMNAPAANGRRCGVLVDAGWVAAHQRDPAVAVIEFAG